MDTRPAYACTYGCVQAEVLPPTRVISNLAAAF
jgi:hypothetical protein